MKPLTFKDMERWREVHGLTVADLCAKLGVLERTWYYMAQGRRIPPDVAVKFWNRT